jgi:hypothetical protein
MSKTRVEWNERLKEQLISEVLKRASQHPELEGSGNLLMQLVGQAFDGLTPLDLNESRLFLVLQSYRGLKGPGGQSIHTKAINLAQRIAPHLPGEKFWLVSPTPNRGVRFESEVATVDVVLNDDVSETAHGR